MNSFRSKTTILPLRNSTSCAPRGRVLLLIALACFALSPQAQAVCQQGCGRGFNSNTFLGEGALAGNTTGNNNTAIGDAALLANTTGFSNTATGAQALEANTTGIYNTAIGVLAL